LVNLHRVGVIRLRLLMRHKEMKTQTLEYIYVLALLHIPPHLVFGMPPAVKLVPCGINGNMDIWVEVYAIHDAIAES